MKWISDEIHLCLKTMAHALSHANHLYLNNNMQNANTPDVDLDRDLISTYGPELGREAVEREKASFRINLSTIAISAFIFMAILAWFDFIQTAFFVCLDEEAADSMIPAPIKLWYALLVTGLCGALILLIIRYSSLRF